MATSKQAQTTVFSRGTASYRAPEVLSEQPSYTNKVDIFALGCILYELVACKKVFREDWAVREYALGRKELPMPQTSWASSAQQGLFDTLSCLLKVDWKERPSALDAVVLIQAARAQLDSLINPFGEGLSFGKWKSTEYKRQLTEKYQNTSDYNAAIAGWMAVIRKYPDDVDLHKEFVALCISEGDVDNPIILWKELTNRFPHLGSCRQALRLFYARKGDPVIAGNGWKELISAHPDQTEFVDEFFMCPPANNIDLVTGWKRLSEVHLNDWEYYYELGSAYEVKGDIVSSIIVWKQAVQRYPQWGNFVLKLSDALGRNRNKDWAIQVWSGLIAANPSSVILQYEFAKAHVELGDHTAAIQAWKDLSVANLHIPQLRHRLAEAIVLQRNENATKMLEELVSENPKDWELKSMLADAYDKGGQSYLANEIWDSKAIEWKRWLKSGADNY